MVSMEHWTAIEIPPMIVVAIRLRVVAVREPKHFL